MTTLTDAQRASLIDVAKSWLGTPWHPMAGQTPARQVRVDCSNLVHAVYVEAGLSYVYADTASFLRLAQFVHVEVPLPGDVVLFGGHLGIATPNSVDGEMISAHGSPTKPGVVRYGQISWFADFKGYYCWR